MVDRRKNLEAPYFLVQFKLVRVAGAGRDGEGFPRGQAFQQRGGFRPFGGGVVPGFVGEEVFELSVNLPYLLFFDNFGKGGV